MKLYEELKKNSREDIKLKLKLDALHAMLDRLNLTGDERIVLAEAILRLERKWGKNHLIPGDAEMKRLVELFGIWKSDKGG